MIVFSFAAWDRELECPGQTFKENCLSLLEAK